MKAKQYFYYSVSCHKGWHFGPNGTYAGGYPVWKARHGECVGEGNTPTEARIAVTKAMLASDTLGLTQADADREVRRAEQIFNGTLCAVCETSAVLGDDSHAYYGVTIHNRCIDRVKETLSPNCMFAADSDTWHPQATVAA